MNNNSENGKLDWMYKGANSLVDREEYLLGRNVDKTLEQINAEEKEKKLGLVPPKNHVEHECIPPSIRDFNKIIQAEQVDISAKLQEDPLVAIKKREEEARRQFLQNPVQLKKLQEALKAQEVMRNKIKHKKSKGKDDDLDTKIAKKLKYLKGNSLGFSKKKNKKSDDDALDTILMHKFNELKDRLSQDDLNDILAGKVSDSDENDEKVRKRKKRKNSSSEESDDAKRSHKKKTAHSKKKRESSSSSSDSSSDSDSSDSDSEKHSKRHKRKDSKSKYRSASKAGKKYKEKSKSTGKRKQRHSSSEDSSSDEEPKRSTQKRTRDRLSRKEEVKSKVITKSEKDSSKKEYQDTNQLADEDLENKILAKLRMLRNSPTPTPNQNSDKSDSESDENDAKVHRYNSDSDEGASKPQTFGLVKADGTKIALKAKPIDTKSSNKKPAKVEAVPKQEAKSAKRLTEKEKEQLRQEMMRNAEKRDKERSENLRKYREEDMREEKAASHFDKDFMQKQLLRTTKDATVESRIKSNLNNIQRSSKHMESHFSRR